MSARPVLFEDPIEEPSRYLRTKFLRRLAHDIASPAGVTMTVLDELAGTARPELITMARRGVKRLLRLSEQLALVAELENGDFVPEKAPGDAGKLIRQAIDLAVGIDGRRDVTVSSTLIEAAKKIAMAIDQRVVLSVIREVIGNALRLASSKVLVEVEPGEKTITIRVHDDGPGFPPDLVPSIGERFTPRSGVRGLGLSLSMAKEILAAHGGELRLETSALPPGRRGMRGAAVALVFPIG